MWLRDEIWQGVERIYAFRFHTRQDHARWQLCFGNNSTHFQLFTNVLQNDSIESVGLFAIWLQMKWVDWLLSKKIWSQFGGTPQLEAQAQRCAGFSAVFNPVSQYAVCYPQRGGESQQRHHRACPPALPCAHHPTMPSVPQLGHQRVFQEEDQINSQKRHKVPKNQSSRNQKVRKVMFAPPSHLQLDHLPPSRLSA